MDIYTDLADSHTGYDTNSYYRSAVITKNAEYAISYSLETNFLRMV